MDEFYQNIIYQKKAIQELEKKLKQDYFKKRILVVFSSQAKKEHLAQIINVLNRACCIYNYITLDRKILISKDDVVEVYSTKPRSYDLVLGVGGGMCSDMTKLLAKKYISDSIFVVSNFGNMSYFNCFAVVEKDELVQVEYTNPHNKVYIDEGWVKNFDEVCYERTIKFLCSLSILIDDMSFYRFVFNHLGQFDLDELKDKLVKMKVELSSKVSPDENKLKLMDYIIEVSRLFKDTQIDYFNSIKMASLLNRLFLKKNISKSFCDLCYLSSLVLQKCYLNFYRVKNIQVYEPFSRWDAQKLFVKFGFKKMRVKDEENKYYYYKNKLFFQKINAMKQKLEKNSLNLRNSLLIFPEKYYVEKGISGNDLYDCVKIYSMIYDSGMVIGLIRRTGLLNA